MTERPTNPIGAVRAPLRLVNAGGGGLSLFSAFGWVLYTTVIVAAFLSLFLLRGAADEAAFEIRRVEQQIEVEMERSHRLQLRKTRLEEPGKIIAVAERMLGMVLPDDVIPVTLPAAAAEPGEAGEAAAAAEPGEPGEAAAAAEAGGDR